MSEYLTIEEVARTLKTTPQTVRLWCKKKKIKARKIPGTKNWLINYDELKKILS